jgi:galactose mutarotase-like enzyme
MSEIVDQPLEIEDEEGDVLRVYSLGAKIELSLKGVSVLGLFARGDGKQGVTHPCTPIFGPDRKNRYGLKQHGNMRNEKTKLQKLEDSIIVSHTITDEGYPAGMLVKQIMSVEDGAFSFVMIHTNTGNTKAAVNSGEHCYFDAPQGFAGTKINGEDVTHLIENNWDGIAIPLKETNVIEIPGKPTIELSQNGFNKAMLWVGKNPETKAIDQSYICIEPVEENPAGDYFGSKQSFLLPGQSRSVMFGLKIK